MMLQLASAWSMWPVIRKIPAFRTLAENVQLSAEPYYTRGTWAVVDCSGVIYADPLRLAPADEWTFVLAHLLAHLGLRHRPAPNAALAAIHEMTANALVVQLGIGLMPEGFLMPQNDWRTDVQAVYADWQRYDVVPPTNWLSAAGPGGCDVISRGSAEPPMDAWAMMLTQGLLESAGGKGGLAPWATVGTSRAKQALHWFVGNFPLLSALAAHFTLIEDRDSIEAFQINVAAVIAERMEILVNPDLDLTAAELRFIMGHELMHVGLLHHKRREDRDPFIWNVACDYVINAWLIEMGVGDMPPRGGLYNPAFAGLSSDEIYDRLIENADYVKTLVTFRGEGVGDMLPPGARGNPRRINGQLAADLAEELMRQGINAHMQGKHGLLPAGLLEMVSPTYAPPPDWKMALSRWFDSHFDQLAPARSYTRLSRRQQATPDIPRPRFAIPQLPDGSSVFGVLLDTSGSMSNQLLGQCLGAIASLAAKHNIKQVRLVFCDAEPHDEGYVPIKRLYEPMPVKGRGGTRLQPGVHLLQTAKDFPKDAPLLIITDGGCDKLDVKRDHAFLLPEGNRLPFNPVGPVVTLKQVGP
ncbi:MAG: peptidase [Anaerolineae bacterium]|nr:peptidase [Anaerolineae bacterium]